MSEARMRAVFVGADRSITVREAAVPRPAPDELVLRPTAAGICGTDLHIVRGEFPQAVFPVTPLHEFAGVVVAVGREAQGFREGDLVTADPNVACGHCRFCRASRPNLCRSLQVVGVTRPGAAAEAVAVPARCAHVLPKGVSADVGAMIEPLACACNAIARAGTLADRRVLVMGCGIMGLLIATAATRQTPSAIWISDPATAKHAIARGTGATRVVTPADLAGERFDVVFEAAGARPAAAQALDLLEPMGVWVQVGVLLPTDTVPLAPFVVFEREISIVGSNSLADKFAAAVELMPDIATTASPFITNRVSVWDFETGLAHARGPTSVKTQLVY